MEKLTVQPSILPNEEDEPVATVFCCPGFFKVPKLCSLKSFRRAFRQHSSKVAPVIVETNGSSPSLSDESEQATPVTTPSSNGPLGLRHCWEENSTTCSTAQEHANKSLSEKCQELSKTVSAAIGHLPKCSNLKDIHTPCKGACGSSQAEKDCDESSRACSLLLRAMTLSHALHDGIISSLNLWKVVGNKPISKPKDCKLAKAEFEEKITKPIRKRMKEIIKDLRRQITLVDEVLQRSDEALEGKSFPKKFSATSDYFKEFREAASECIPSKVLADFARAVSATQTLINKSSFLSDRLSALGPDIPLAVKHPFLHTSVDGITYKGYTLEKRLTRLVKELAEYRKAMLYVSDEIKTLDGKLKKQAKKDQKRALKKKLGNKKCPKSNRTAAQLNMAQVPSRRVISIMPSIEEVEETE